MATIVVLGYHESPKDLLNWGSLTVSSVLYLVHVILVWIVIDFYKAHPVDKTLLRGIALACAIPVVFFADRLPSVVGQTATSPQSVAAATTATAAKPMAGEESALPAGIKLVTTIEGIEEFKMDNGIKLLLLSDASKPQFTINVTIDVGSRHEGYGESGMAHLLEHMLFKGTDKYLDTPKHLKDRGVLNMNGTTWVDRTNYFETLPASDENLEFAIDMESDRLVNSLIKGSDLASEMTVVRSEFERGENSPQRVLMQRIMANAYEWHNYGKSTIGNRSDIERVPVDALREFYQKYYQPDNVMVVIAGKFNRNKALSLVSQYFGALETPDRTLPQTYTQEPEQDGERRVVLKRSGDVRVLGVGYHVPAASNEDYAAVEVMVALLSNQPDGPLYENLVKTEKMSSASAFALKTHDPGMMLVMGELNEDSDAAGVEKILLDTVEDLKGEITEKRVKREIQSILKQRERLFANSESFAVQLSEWQAYGDWRLFFLHRDRIEKVTVEQVKAAAEKYLVADNRTVGLFLPTDNPKRAPIPDTVNLDSVLADYKGRAAIAEGEDFDPAPENIKKRTVKGEFESGVKYALLSKKTRGEKVIVSGQLQFGSLESLGGEIQSCRIMGALMSRGTQTISYQKFRDRLNELGATLGISASVGKLNFSIEAKNKTLIEVLTLLKSALREPLFDQDEFDVLCEQQITRIKSGLSDPTRIAARTIGRKMSPYEKGDPRFVATMEEEIASYQALSVDDVKSVYKQVSGSHGQIAVVGDFDPETIKPALNALVDGWQSESAYARIAEPAPEGIQGERITINTPDKKNATYFGALVRPMNDSDPDYEAMLVGNYLLGGGPLSSRLADRVRKKEGLSYSVGSQFRADNADKQAMVSIFAISNPDNTEKVVSTIEEVIEDYFQNGIADDELAKGVDSYLTQRKGGRARDRALAGLLRSNLEIDRDMTFYAQSDQRIANLTKDQVESAMKSFLNMDDMVIVTAGDFEKKTPSENPTE